MDSLAEAEAGKAVSAAAHRQRVKVARAASAAVLHPDPMLERVVDPELAAAARADMVQAEPLEDWAASGAH